MPGAAGLSAGSDPAWRGRRTHLAGRGAGQHDPLRRLRRGRGRVLPRICAIGIDAEPDAPLPDGVLDLVATPAERDRLAATQPEPDGPNWDRLLFSAKEAVYKAWFPLVGEWLDHQQAEISFDPHDRTFTAQLSHDGLIVNGRQVRRLHGRWIQRARDPADRGRAGSNLNRRQRSWSVDVAKWARVPAMARR